MDTDAPLSQPGLPSDQGTETAFRHQDDLAMDGDIMHPDHEELHETLKHLVRLLVDDPGSVTITPDTNLEGACFHIRVAETDLGKIIGKRGRTARALRTLVACHAHKIGVPITIDIVS